MAWRTRNGFVNTTTDEPFTDIHNTNGIVLNISRLAHLTLAHSLKKKRRKVENFDFTRKHSSFALFSVPIKLFMSIHAFFIDILEFICSRHYPNIYHLCVEFAISCSRIHLFCGFYGKWQHCNKPLGTQFKVFNWKLKHTCFNFRLKFCWIIHKQLNSEYKVRNRSLFFIARSKQLCNEINFLIYC